MSEEARLRVRLTPRADRDAIGAFEGETLHVRVAAPPVDGRANEALTRLLAAALGVPRGAVRVVGGQASRLKVVAVKGLAADEVRTRVEAARAVGLRPAKARAGLPRSEP